MNNRFYAQKKTTIIRNSNVSGLAVYVTSFLNYYYLFAIITTTTCDFRNSFFRRICVFPSTLEIIKIWLKLENRLEFSCFWLFQCVCPFVCVVSLVQFVSKCTTIKTVYYWQADWLSNEDYVICYAQCSMFICTKFILRSYLTALKYGKRFKPYTDTTLYLLLVFFSFLLFYFSVTFICFNTKSNRIRGTCMCLGSARQTKKWLVFVCGVFLFCFFFWPNIYDHNCLNRSTILRRFTAMNAIICPKIIEGKLDEKASDYVQWSHNDWWSFNICMPCVIYAPTYWNPRKEPLHWQKKRNFHIWTFEHWLALHCIHMHSNAKKNAFAFELLFCFSCIWSTNTWQTCRMQHCLNHKCVKIVVNATSNKSTSSVFCCCFSSCTFDSSGSPSNKH